jgi:hypothetical protein
MTGTGTSGVHDSGEPAAGTAVASLLGPRPVVIVPLPTGDPARDQANIEAALAEGSARKEEVFFPASRTWQLIRPLLIGQGSVCPPKISGLASRLVATSVMGGAKPMTGVITVWNPQALVDRFELSGLILDAANFTFRCLTIHGMQDGYIHDLSLLNAASIGLALDGGDGHGIYTSEIGRIKILKCGYVGAQFLSENFATDPGGSRIQANDIHGLKIMQCGGQPGGGGGGIMCDGFQGKIRNTDCEQNTGFGCFIRNTREIVLDEMYFEANMLNGVDTCVVIDNANIPAPSSDPANPIEGVKRIGGHWIGQIQGRFAGV